MAGVLVGSDPADAFRVEPLQRHLVERLAPEALHVLVVEAAVLPVEVPDELGPRAPLEREPAGSAPRDVGEECRPLGERLRFQAHPDEVLDDVGLDQRAVDVEDGDHVGPAFAPLDLLQRQVLVWRRRCAASRLLAPAGDGIGARHPDHRRQVDLVQVVPPVEGRRVEGEDLSLGRGQRLPDVHQVLRLIDAVDVRVDAVELEDLEGAVQPDPALVEVVRDARHVGAGGKPLDDPLGDVDRSFHRLGPPLDLVLRWERPFRRPDRLAVAVAQGMDLEVLPAEVDHGPQPERVPVAGGRVVDAVLARPGRRRRHRQNRVDDEVGRDQVEHRVGQAGEVGQHPAGEGQDDRLRHSEALQPAGEGLGQGALDDRRPQDAERHLPMQLDDRALCHRLGERVDVREAHSPGVDAAPLDEPVLDPLLAQPLDGARHRRRPRRPHPRAGLTLQL